VHESLRARLANGQAGEGPLTLAGLAAAYGISMMPVRLAVGRLIDEGLLERRDGRLVFIDRSPGGARLRTRVAQPTPPRNHEQEIQRDLIRMSFGTPPGALREDHWAAQFGTTRTVIRQVFARLAGQGLLEHRPRHGWYLRAFSVKDLRDFLQAREALELKALELARGRLETPVLRDLLAGNVLPRGSAHPRTDNRLHAYIIARADNRYISSFFERHGPYYDLLF
jgi:DNA-binding GntR family transcriptional regulator